MPQIRFAPEFVDRILAGHKRATTRLIRTAEERAPREVGTLYDAVRADDETVFAVLRITAIEERTFADIDDALARIETYRRAEELRSSLRRFYPDIQDEDQVRIIHFGCVADPSAG